MTVAYTCRRITYLRITLLMFFSTYRPVFAFSNVTEASST